MGEGVSLGGAKVFYSLDEGKTKFFDLLQMVEFYQLNRGSLNTRLTHYIVKEEVAQAALARAVNGGGGSTGSQSSGSSSGASSANDAEGVLGAKAAAPAAAAAATAEEADKPEKEKLR